MLGGANCSAVTSLLFFPRCGSPFSQLRAGVVRNETTERPDDSPLDPYLLQARHRCLKVWCAGVGGGKSSGG